MHPLESLHTTLQAAGTLLDQAAGQIRDARLEPVRENIGKIGESLALLFELQDAINKQAPELGLAPKYDEPPQEVRDANRRLGSAMLAADELATAGDFASAQASLRRFAATEPSPRHAELALAQLNRYEPR